MTDGVIKPLGLNSNTFSVPMTLQILPPTIEPEHPDVQPRVVRFARHAWTGSAQDVNVAPLALPAAAEERREAMVRIDVQTDGGSADLPLPMRVERCQEHGRAAFRITGTLYHLAITFNLGGDEKEGTIHWRLDPGGQDATSRAAVLDLLIAMSGSGSLVLWDDEDNALLRLHLTGAPLDKSIVVERQF